MADIGLKIRSRTECVVVPLRHPPRTPTAVSLVGVFLISRPDTGQLWRRSTQILGMSTTLAPNIPAGIPTRTTTAILQTTYGISRDWSVGVRGGYTRGEFIGFGGLNNHGWMAGASFNYEIWRNLMLTLDYQYTTVIEYVVCVVHRIYATIGTVPALHTSTERGGLDCGSKRDWNEEPRGLEVQQCIARRCIPALLFMVLIAMQSTASSAGSSTIGVAASIKPSAEVGVGANLQTLSPGSELHASETVRTGNLGQADLVFIDSTNLTVGPASEVLLDQFVYDPIGSSGRVVMQAKRGAIRFVTGKQDHSAYQLKTPYGTAVFARSYDLDNGAGSALLFAYAPTDHSGKNANARSSANDAYAQAVGRGAGSVVTFEVLSEEEKKKTKGQMRRTR